MESETMWRSERAAPYLGLALTSVELRPFLGDSVTYIGGRSAVTTQRAFKAELHTPVYFSNI